MECLPLRRKSSISTLCVSHLVASMAMWLCLYYYEPSATCSGLLFVNMLHLSGLASFDFTAI